MGGRGVGRRLRLGTGQRLTRDKRHGRFGVARGGLPSTRSAAASGPLPSTATTFIPNVLRATPAAGLVFVPAPPVRGGSGDRRSPVPAPAPFFAAASSDYCSQLRSSRTAGAAGAQRRVLAAVEALTTTRSGRRPESSNDIVVDAEELPASTPSIVADASTSWLWSSTASSISGPARSAVPRFKIRTSSDASARSSAH